MNSTQSRRKRCHLIAEYIRFHSKIDRKFPLGQDDAGRIDALLASERELRRENAAMRKALRSLRDELSRVRDVVGEADVELIDKVLKGEL